MTTPDVLTDNEAIRKRNFRRLSHQLAAGFVAAMTARKMDYADMAKNLQEKGDGTEVVTEAFVRNAFTALVVGKEVDLRTISDLACALDYRIKIDNIESTFQFKLVDART